MVYTNVVEMGIFEDGKEGTELGLGRRPKAVGLTRRSPKRACSSEGLFGTSSLSHPFLRTKIGCIKDSCAP
jgi:hypothetical protein